MTEYKQLLKTLFNSYTKTHELSSRIVDPQLRRNHIKKNEGNYRRFQDEIVHRYEPEEQIDHGLIRYYHHLAECQYRTILLIGCELGSKCMKINPYPRRYENFDINRQHKAKIEFDSFLKPHEQ